MSIAPKQNYVAAQMFDNAADHLATAINYMKAGIIQASLAGDDNAGIIEAVDDAVETVATVGLFLSVLTISYSLPEMAKAIREDK